VEHEELKQGADNSSSAAPRRTAQKLTATSKKVSLERHTTTACREKNISFNPKSLHDGFYVRSI
jgi:hypothetical protein